MVGYLGGDRYISPTAVSPIGAHVGSQEAGRQTALNGRPYQPVHDGTCRLLGCPHRHAYHRRHGY